MFILIPLPESDQQAALLCRRTSAGNRRQRERRGQRHRIPRIHLPGWVARRFKGYHLLIQRQKRLTFDHPELDIDSLLRLKCANRSLGFRAVVALVTSSQSEAERMGSIRETPQGLELGIAKRSLRRSRPPVPRRSSARDPVHRAPNSP